MRIEFPNLWIKKGDAIVKRTSHLKWLIIIVVCNLVTISMLSMLCFCNNLYCNFAMTSTTTLLQPCFTMVWWCFCCCEYYKELYYDKICLHFVPKIVGEGCVGLFKLHGEGCISCHWLKLTYFNCLDLVIRYSLSLATRCNLGLIIMFTH